MLRHKQAEAKEPQASEAKAGSKSKMQYTKCVFPDSPNPGEAS